jgi:membrane carboxypeptidase/penicillin-binding protein
MRPASASRYGRAASANPNRQAGGLGNQDTVSESPSPEHTAAPTYISPDDDDAYAKALERAINRGTSARTKQRIEDRDERIARQLAAGLIDEDDLDLDQAGDEASALDDPSIIKQVVDAAGRPITARTKQQLEDDGKDIF